MNKRMTNYLNEAWSWTATKVKQVCDDYISAYSKLIENIIMGSNHTFANTIEAINDFEINNNMTINYAIFLQNISNDTDIREAANEAENKMNDFNMSMYMNTKLYTVILQVYEEESKNLVDEDLKAIEEIIKIFKRYGTHLNASVKNKIKKLLNDIDTLSVQYSANILNDKSTIELTTADLEGMPDLFFKTINNYPNVATKYVVPLKQTYVMPILLHAVKRDTRKHIEYAYYSKCPENIDILIEIVGKRKEAAHLLGYTSWAEYILEQNMAQNPETVKSFIYNLQNNLADKKMEAIKKLTSTVGEYSSTSGEQYIHSYDWLYALELYKHKCGIIDDMVFREYYTLTNVLQYMFLLFAKLFGMKFKKIDVPVWHPDVLTYSIYKNKKEIGIVYLDLYARNNKFTHAASFVIKYATIKDPFSITALITNYMRVVDTNITALLSHREIETLFHEFGHVIHNAMGITKYIMFSGLQTVMDFVEAPSQMLEHFCWEFDTLKKMSSHYISGKSLSDKKIRAIIEGRKANMPLMILRQLTYALVDLNIHSEKIYNKEDMNKLFQKVYHDMGGIIMSINLNPLSQFNHLVNSYDAQYYGYMWSLIYADDIYHTLRERLKNNSQAGIEYITIILSKGGAESAFKLLKSYLRREPNSKAFIKRF